MYWIVRNGEIIENKVSEQKTTVFTKKINKIKTAY